MALDKFNMPYYATTAEEVRHVIKTEGSFDIQRLEIVKVDWDANMNKNLRSGKHNGGTYVAMTIRVVSESILASHFGEEIMDNLFQRFAIKMDEYLVTEKGEYANIVVSMKRKNN